VLLWAIGLVAMRRVGETALASAPPSWRQRVAPGQEQASSTAYAAAFWLVLFALLDLTDVLLGIQLGVAAAYSVWATASERGRQREEVARWEGEGLEPLQRNRRLAWSFVGSYLAMLFGFTAAMCFAARAVIELAGG
jgi:hypothetical protein